jgi:hypothetical protein
MSLDRIVRFLRRVGEAVVDEVRPLDGATALLTPSLPLVWELNAVRVEDRDAGPEEVIAAAEEALGNVSHRKLVVHDSEQGARLAAELSRSGGTSTGCW